MVRNEKCYCCWFRMEIVEKISSGWKRESINYCWREMWVELKRMLTSSCWEQYHEMIMTCICLSWTKLEELYCPECNHSRIGWQQEPHRSWSWSRIQILCTCSFEGHGSLLRFEQLQKVQTVAREGFLPYLVLNCKRTNTIQLHSQDWRPVMDSPAVRQPVESICS